MRITSVEALPITITFASIFGGKDNVPREFLTPASHFRRFPRIGQQSTLVRMRTDDGITGFGEAFGIPAPEVSAVAVRKVLAPLLVGERIDNAKTLYADIEQYLINIGHSRGPLMEGLSAIDIALWDIAGKQAGKPVVELLGGSVGQVETYVSPVTLTDDPAHAAASARAYVADGFTAIKLKVGQAGTKDIRNLEAVRDAVGPDVRIVLDANGGFDVKTAIAFARDIAHLNPSWLEEPIAPNDMEGLAEVRRSVKIPIAWGENEFTAGGVRDAILRGAIDIVQPNVTRAGGISGSHKIAVLAGQHDVGFAPHGVGTGLGITAMLHVCRVAPTFDVYEVNRLLNPLRDTFVRPASRLEKGNYHLNGSPGLGVDVPWDDLAAQFGRKAANA